MSTGRLSIQKNDALFYTAVFAAVLAVACRLWYNFSCYGALNEELAGLPSRLMPGEDFGGGMLTLLGLLHLAADVALPVGMALAIRQLWAAGLGIAVRLLYNAVFCVMDVVMYGAGAVLFSVLGSLFAEGSEYAFFEFLTSFLGVLAGVIAVLAVATLLPFIAMIIAAVSQIAVYVAAQCGRIKNRAVVAAVSAVSWVLFAVAEVIFISVLGEETGFSESAALLLIAALPTVAALLFGLSLRTKERS